MALGRKKQRQDSLWIGTQELPRTGGHVFYERVNRVLEENGFDRFVEDACEKFYAPVMGRPGLAPGCTFGCSWWATSRGSIRNVASPGDVPTL